MAPRLMGGAQPAGCAGGDSVIGMGEDESALILIRHCNHMKQQETRLRLITLLLLLVTLALVLFTHHLSPWRQGSLAAAGPEAGVSPGAARLSQDGACPAGAAPEASDLPGTLQRWRVHHTSELVPEEPDGQYLRWDAGSGDIVIPLSGHYFVYVRTTLRCHDKVEGSDYELFKLELHCWNAGYNQTRELAQAWDGVDCSRGSDVSRNVFLGQIFDLLQGDRVSVFIKHGFDLVEESFFGAYDT